MDQEFLRKYFIERHLSSDEIDAVLPPLQESNV